MLFCVVVYVTAWILLLTLLISLTSETALIVCFVFGLFVFKKPLKGYCWRVLGDLWCFYRVGVWHVFCPQVRAEASEVDGNQSGMICVKERQRENRESVEVCVYSPVWVSVSSWYKMWIPAHRESIQGSSIYYTLYWGWGPWFNYLNIDHPLTDIWHPNRLLVMICRRTCQSVTLYRVSSSVFTCFLIISREL